MSNRPEVGDRVPAAEGAVAAALRAFEVQDWETLVTLTDTDSLVALKASYLAQKREMARLRAMEAERWELMESSPELAEWMARRREFGELAGVRTFDEAEALGIEEFLRRWAQARHPEYLVDGVAPWNAVREMARRMVVGSVALLPDTVAVIVRETNTHPLNTLAAHSMIAVLGDNRGGWSLDAANGWLGLADFYVG